MSHSDPLNGQRWLSFLNQSGAEIPSYGVIQMKSDTGTTDATYGYKRRLVAIKPDEKCGDSATTIAFNSGTPVPDGKYGNCHYAIEAPTWARIEHDSGEDQDLDLADNNLEWIEKEFGPKEDRWDINSGGSGYLLQSAPDLENHRVLVRSQNSGLVLCKSKHTVPLGPRNVGGIEKEGPCVSLSTHAGPTWNDAEFDVRFNYLSGIVVREQEFWAIHRYGYWWAVAGGTTVIHGPTTGATRLTDPSIEYTSTYTDDVYEIEVQDYCDEIIPDGANALAHFEKTSNSCVFWVSRYCCAPVVASN